MEKRFSNKNKQQEETIPENLAYMLDIAKNSNSTVVIIGIVHSTITGLTISTAYKQAWQNLWQTLADRAVISDSVFEAVVTGISITLDMLDEKASDTVKGEEPGHVPSVLLDELKLWTDRANTIISNLYPELLQRTGRQPQDPKIIDMLTRRIIDRAVTYGISVCKSAARPNTNTPEADETEIAAWREQQTAEIKAATLNKLDWPLDRPNSQVWDDISEIPKNDYGQIMFATEGDGRPEATVLYSIDFKQAEELGVTITKQLTEFDKYVYIAVGSLFHKTAEMSLGQIFVAMGNKGKPNATQRKKLNDSLTKLRAATIYIDSTPEKNKATRYKYDGDLLPFERITATVNGAPTESAIHLLREPPMLEFARKRRQITTIPRQLLENGLKQTDENLRLQDYLLQLISHMKHPRNKISRTITLATLHERLKINGTSDKHKKARQRLPEKVRGLLEHWKNTGWITSYTEAPDRFTIQP